MIKVGPSSHKIAFLVVCLTGSVGFLDLVDERLDTLLLSGGLGWWFGSGNLLSGCSNWSESLLGRIRNG